MHKTTYPLLLFILWLLIACSKKAVPVITERTVPASGPAPTVVLTEPDHEKGKVIYTNRCSRCHGLPEAGQYDEKKWTAIMTRMAPKARLSEQEVADVKAYIKKDLTK
jgi:mono/diheme cytochrome c family protein